MPRQRVETRARARALQALYAWDLRAGEPLDRVAAQIWDDLGVPADERSFAGRILRTLLANGAHIDDALRDVTTNWRLERLGAIERSVLRLAGAELLAGETPPRVAIQEGVTLAERYGSPQSARFVNGVLDALARKMGRL
jgi:N utilization substance protein B